MEQGYAPGSWSQVIIAVEPTHLAMQRVLSFKQVAVDRTAPDGRVVGIDVIPAQPPKGVSTLQGNFLSPTVQEEVKRFLGDADWGRPYQQKFSTTSCANHASMQAHHAYPRDLLDLQKETASEKLSPKAARQPKRRDQLEENASERRLVDVILSDMSEPWAQTDGFWKRSLSDPYYRMMNTSGNNFRDHMGSMVSSLLTLSITYLCPDE